MGKTFKDRRKGKRRDGKPVLDYTSHYPGVKSQLKHWTNRGMRNHKGAIDSGGQYKRMFETTWDYI